MAPRGTRSSRHRPVMPHRGQASQMPDLTWRSNIRRRAIGRHTALRRAVLHRTARLQRVKKIRTTPHAVQRE
jgi:hypothetical protein